MSSLDQFTALMQTAAAAKVAKKQESYAKNAPLLQELFQSVAASKEAQKKKIQEARKENKGLLAELSTLVAGKGKVAVDKSNQIVELIQTLEGKISALEQTTPDTIEESRTSEQIASLQEEMRREMERLRKDMAYATQEFGYGGAGGGSTKLMQNDDVGYMPYNQLLDNTVLIWSAAYGKFMPESMTSIINRIKVDLEMQYSRMVDVSGSFTYVGEAVPGSATSDPKWRIKRIETLNAEGDINIFWADGTADFTKSWDSRGAYSYTS